MTIRTATSDDAAEISTFVSKLSAEHIASSLGDGGLELLLGSMDHASTLQRIADNWPHFCAFRNGSLVGVAVVKPPLHLYHLFVRTDLHRSGIGTELLAAADEYCIRMTGTQISTVNSSLNAVNVYKCLGFDSNGPIVDTNGVKHQPMARQNA